MEEHPSLTDIHENLINMYLKPIKKEEQDILRVILPSKVVKITIDGKSIKKGNIGENDEVDCKKKLYENKDNFEYLVDIFGNDACEGIEIINHDTKLPYTSIKEIKKTPPRFKADVIIILKKTQKQLNISIKSQRGGKPSIVNQTPRSANVFQNGYLILLLYLFDVFAKEYSDKRKLGIFKEDVEIGKFDSYNNDENVKNALIEFLRYFIFKGTGSKISYHESDSILVINKDNSLTFTLCDTEEKQKTYILSIIEQCPISFRSKGMPEKIVDDCLPWVYVNDKGKYCGSINVRLAIK